MAIVIGSLDRILIKYPTVNINSLKFIGWGAGQQFKDHFKHLEISIEYTICPLTQNQGKNINGVRVEKPEILNQEDPSKTVILIFSSASNEIINQIRNLGDFMCVPALTFGMDSVGLISELQSLAGRVMEPPVTRQGSYAHGFFYQGPIFPYTELALAYQRLRFPNDYHCLVTDTNQNPENLSRCKRWVDHLIELTPPQNPGIFRRNLMLQTAKRGALDILEKNIDFCVRVRSGNIVVGNLRKYINDRFAGGSINKGKIGFYMGWSWKNVPFHISDAFMVANTSDMVRLWSAPADPRLPDHFANLDDSKLHYSELAKITNESYLWSHYAKIEGHKAESLLDYYNFMKEKLIPLEPDLTTFSLKHVPIFNIELDKSFSPDEYWWKSFCNNFEGEYRKGIIRFTSECSIQDYWRGGLG